MRQVWTIFKKEFALYFNSTIAYVFIVVFLVVSTWFYFSRFFVINQADMRWYFQDILPWVFLIFVPAVTMRLWAEEKRSHTMEVLMTLPFRDAEVVAGKFLAAFAFIALAVILTFPIPFTLWRLGNPDFGPIIGSYIGAFLLGGAYVAIGMFVSSFSDNQIIAFIISIVVTFVLFVVGEPFFLQSVPAGLKGVAEYLGLASHFQNIGKGVIDTRDIIYYFSVMFVFVYATMRQIESRLYA